MGSIDWLKMILGQIVLPCFERDLVPFRKTYQILTKPLFEKLSNPPLKKGCNKKGKKWNWRNCS